MAHRPRILHIVSSLESEAGSGLAEFVTRIPCDEFACEICALANSNGRKTPHVPTTTLGLRWSFDVSTFLGIGRILRRFRPDAVHTWDAAAQLYGHLAAIQYGTKRILAEKKNTDAPKGWLQKYLDRKTCRFIVPQKDNTLPNDRTVVIPQAAVFVPCVDPIPIEELLKNYAPSYRQKPFLIGVVLPLGLEQRTLDALWVFETLNHVHLNFHAFVIGDGKDQELSLRYRDRWKLFSRVHFLGSRHDTNRLLPCFDVLLHLSPSPEHSGTILSAMSCGVPVVALETPESREYIVDGTTGFLIPCDGDFRFYRRTATNRLLHLQGNEELRQSMQIAAKDRIAKEFNSETAVHQKIQVYRELFARLR